MLLIRASANSEITIVCLPAWPTQSAIPTIRLSVGQRKRRQKILIAYSYAREMSRRFAAHSSAMVEEHKPWSRRMKHREREPANPDSPWEAQDEKKRSGDPVFIPHRAHIRKAMRNFAVKPRGDRANAGRQATETAAALSFSTAMASFWALTILRTARSRHSMCGSLPAP